MANVRKLTGDNTAEIAEWCGGVQVVEHNALDTSLTQPALNVPCRDGGRRASVGDYVLKYRDGTFDVKTPSEYRNMTQELLAGEGTPDE